jgi:hypothetical protein
MEMVMRCDICRGPVVPKNKCMDVGVNEYQTGKLPRYPKTTHYSHQRALILLVVNKSMQHESHTANRVTITTRYRVWWTKEI